MVRNAIPQTTLQKMRRVVDVCARGHRESVQIASKTRLAIRQADYALSGASAIGLLERTEEGFKLSPQGRELAAAKRGSEAGAAIFAKAIDRSETINSLAPALLSGAPPSVNEIASRMSTVGGLASSTARHRAGMLLAWRRQLVNRKMDFTKTRRAATEKVATVLQVKQFAQIENARIEFGDLTVLVGPQATGKSLVLQWFKAAIDAGEIVSALREAGHDVSTPNNLVDLVFGEGMHAAWTEKSSVLLDSRAITPAAWTRGLKKRDAGKVFFIPAHRALLLAEGWPAPFIKLNADTPVVARLFSQNLYQRFSGREGSGALPCRQDSQRGYRTHIDEANIPRRKCRPRKGGPATGFWLKYDKVNLPS